VIYDLCIYQEKISQISERLMDLERIGYEIYDEYLGRLYECCQIYD